MIEYELAGSSQQPNEEFYDEDSLELDETLDRTNEIVNKNNTKF
jgi:hypothetical protein